MVKPATVARDLMTTNLVTLSPGCDVFSAIDVLLKHRISGAPVVSADGEFLGIFSERSCMEVVVNALYDGLPDATLMPFVDSDPPTITPDTDLLTICQTFLNQATRRLPVLEGRRLLGQISRRDVMRVVSQLSKVEKPVHGEVLYLSALNEDSSGILMRIS
ncbi:MAG: CBS domain-containing protein [Pirellulaceae bacterium]|nr:CBS domain-containing protein [Pirellulaceae bacterium]